MLGTERLCAFVPTSDGERARTFYVDILGLDYVSDDMFALVVRANGVTVRISKGANFTPQQFTVLGWEVDDIDAIVAALGKKGIVFEQFGLPGQDERGIWTAPKVENATGGAKVAWFKDPDGNILSVTELTNE